MARRKPRRSVRTSSLGVGLSSLEQIRDLVQSNVADAVIIDQIHLTRSVYQLTPDQIVWLKQVGV